MSRLRFPLSLTGFVFALSLMVIASMTPTAAYAEESHLCETCVKVVNYLNGVAHSAAHSAKDALCPLEQPQATKVSANSKPPRTRWAPEFKGEGELNRYLECYITEDGRYNEVAKKYMPTIEAAAKAFDLPQSVLACLLLRESRFDPKATSPTGAFGLGQYTGGTMEEVTNIIKPQPLAYAARMEKLASRNKSSEEIAAVEKKGGQALKDMKHADTKLTMNDLRLKWDEYYGDINERRCKKKFPQKDAKTAKNIAKCVANNANNIPRSITREKLASDPQLAIGSAAFRLHQILRHFEKTLKSAPKKENGDDQNPNYHLMLAAAGAYNVGPGVVELLRTVKPANAKAWNEALMKSNEETAGYLLSIRNCVEPSSSPAGNAWKGPISSANYDCDAKGDKRVVLDNGAVNELPSKYQNKFKTASFSQTKLKTSGKTPEKKSEKKAESKTSTPKPKKEDKTKKKGRDT